MNKTAYYQGVTCILEGACWNCQYGTAPTFEELIEKIDKALEKTVKVKHKYLFTKDRVGVVLLTLESLPPKYRVDWGDGIISTEPEDDLEFIDKEES